MDEKTSRLRDRTVVPGFHELDAGAGKAAPVPPSPEAARMVVANAEKIQFTTVGTRLLSVSHKRARMIHPCPICPLEWRERTRWCGNHKVSFTTSFLLTLGFVSSTSDACVYKMDDGGVIL